MWLAYRVEETFFSLMIPKTMKKDGVAMIRDHFPDKLEQVVDWLNGIAYKD